MWTQQGLALPKGVLVASKVLIVDDQERTRQLEARLLEVNGYRCTMVASSADARECLKRQRFDLALIDINMPGESGLVLARDMGTEHPYTGKLIVTGMDDVEMAKTALTAGAYGYLVKPFQPNDLLIQVAAAIHHHDLEKKKQLERDQLEQALRERTASLQDIINELGGALRNGEELIHRLARAGECRDDETGQHVQRMSRYCGLLASRAGLGEERSWMIRLASTTHDVGKIGIPDHILLKPGPLDQEEFGIMQQHADIGYLILCGSKLEMVGLAAIIAWTHHEKFDGSGYPRGLRGGEIPVEARIAAIADVFDALTTDRIYRPAYPLDEALALMRDGRGLHFDPTLLGLFLASLDDILGIQKQYSDSERRAARVQIPRALVSKS